MNIWEGLLFGLGLGASGMMAGAIGADLYLRRILGIPFGRRTAVATLRSCRECGCTDVQACYTNNGPCCWVGIDLCSACAWDGGK